VSLTVTGLARYPVKSCRGTWLTRADVEPWGLAGDRRWMLVDADGCVVTAREHPRLILVTPEPAGPVLRLRAPDREPLSIGYPDDGELVPVRVWRSELKARLAEPAAAEWFSSWLDVSVRLVYLDDPTRRHPNPAYTRPDDLVSLADAYPLLLTSTESLGALNELIAGGAYPKQGPLPMVPFRPNVVVEGAPAWTEDGWRRIRIGSVPFRVVKACDRCVLTTIDPDTATKGKEPMATLARHRQWDGNTWFGVQLVPDAIGTVQVGDAVQVVEATDSSEPLR
jgi:MOSC domain-containing protein